MNGDPRALVRDIDFSLKQCKDPRTPNSCDARLFYKSLQFPFSAGGGVLCGTLNNFDTESWTAVLQEGMDWAISGKRDTIPVKNRILLAVTIQKFKSDSSRGTPKSEDKAMHVEFPRDLQSKGIRLLKLLVKTYVPLNQMTNLPLMYAPAHHRDMKSGEQAQLKGIKNFNTKMASCLNMAYTEAIQNIDLPSKRLGGLTLRRILLALCSKKQPKNLKLIMAVEMQWNGKYGIWYNDAVQTETEELLKFLHLYVARSMEHNKEAIDKWFTGEALEEAEDWTWDETLQRPISLIETQMKEDLAGGNAAVSGWMTFSNLEALGDDDNLNPLEDALARPTRGRERKWDEGSVTSMKTTTNYTDKPLMGMPSLLTPGQLNDEQVSTGAPLSGASVSKW